MEDIREDMFEIALEGTLGIYDKLNEKYNKERPFGYEAILLSNNACRDTVRDIIKLHKDMRKAEINK